MRREEDEAELYFMGEASLQACLHAGAEMPVNEGLCRGQWSTIYYGVTRSAGGPKWL